MTIKTGIPTGIFSVNYLTRAEIRCRGLRDSAPKEPVWVYQANQDGTKGLLKRIEYPAGGSVIFFK